MATLDLELLRAFVAVAERRSFTRAAAALHRTQSAVSTQVRRLEAQVEAALFRRTTARVDLTAAGEVLLDDARRMLALNDAAFGHVRRQGAEGVVRLGVMDDYGVVHVPALLARFAASYPRVQVEMETGLTAPMLRRLGRELDLVIAMHAADGNGSGELLRSERAVWAAGRHHTPEEQRPLPLALYPVGCLFRRWATEALDAAGLCWRLAFVGHGLAAVAAVAAEGLAVTVVKAGTLPSLLRTISLGAALPPLPAVEIRLHRATTTNAAAMLLGDHLAGGLRAG